MPRSRRSSAGLPSAAAIASISERSAMAVDDARAVEVVGRELAAHAIAGEDANPVAAHLACDMAEDNMIVVELDAKHRVRQCLDHLAVKFDLVFFWHPRANHPAGAPERDSPRPWLVALNLSTHGGAQLPAAGGLVHPLSARRPRRGRVRAVKRPVLLLTARALRGEWLLPPALRRRRPLRAAAHPRPAARAPARRPVLRRRPASARRRGTALAHAASRSQCSAPPALPSRSSASSCIGRRRA